MPLEQSVSALLAALRPEEKAGLCSGADFWHTRAVDRLGLPARTMAEGPQRLCPPPAAPGAEAKPEGDDEAVCFPAGCALAAGFDREAARRLGAALGRQAKAAGVGLLLGPSLNIKRSPLGGRNFETFSEDPYWAGQLAAAFVQGVQGAGVAAAPRYFAADSQATRRFSVDCRLDERTLREIYLPAFETVVKTAHPAALMVGSHRINGEYLCENPRLLRDLLRGEWGFDGFLLTDLGAVPDRAKALAAGVALDRPPAGTAPADPAALPQPALDEAVALLLKGLARCDTDDPADAPDTADTDRPQAALPDTPAARRLADRRLAAQLATECAVLVQNKGALPLPKGRKVVYIGGFARTPRYQGGGSTLNSGCVVSALHAAEANHRAVGYQPGFPADRDQRDEAEFLAAVSAAAEAEAAVIFAGLPESFESQGSDRRHLRLPECQNNLIARVAAVQKNTVVVLHTGAPVECPWAEDVNAVLCMYLAGEGVGTATDALLWGDANPAGRLPESWPLAVEQSPCYLDFPGDGVTADYREGVFVGYRWYDARRLPVRWAFGHGLSYTGFVYRDAAVTTPDFDADADGAVLEVRVTLQNRGSRRGAEVVQLYLADETETPLPGGRVPQQLRGLQKLWLDPGESATVTFALTARDFSHYSPLSGGWLAAPGRYELRLGHSSRDIRAALPVVLHTRRRPPLTVDENTPLGLLRADDRTAPTVNELADRRWDGSPPCGWEDRPLRTLTADPAAATALVARLRAALDPSEQ